MEKARPKCPPSSRLLSHHLTSQSHRPQPSSRQVPALSRSRWELHHCPSPCPTPLSSDPPALPAVPTAGASAISTFPIAYSPHHPLRPSAEPTAPPSTWSEPPLQSNRPPSARRRPRKREELLRLDWSEQPPPPPPGGKEDPTAWTEVKWPQPHRPTYTGMNRTVHFYRGGRSENRKMFLQRSTR